MGNIAAKKKTVVIWGALPEIEHEGERIRSKECFDLATKYAIHTYEVKLHQGLTKSAVYQIPLYCYVTTGKHVFFGAIN